MSATFPDQGIRLKHNHLVWSTVRQQLGFARGAFSCDHTTGDVYVDVEFAEQYNGYGIRTHQRTYDCWVSSQMLIFDSRGRVEGKVWINRWGELEEV